MSETKSASAIGAFGWPLVNSAYFPGEKTLACPQCGSTDIVMGCHPGHDRRMGSPGTKDYVLCVKCRKYATESTKKVG